eukprot:TRINITY_DN175_c0_g5_i1.p1 TRINITY_DN175_c0_g5~~TRINITY_DN175_c0_g5_i1.p1  ORF type:complete len:173 (+),score=46.42 TRINITY_DN175_c0_g5_i1:453-971(+)
MKMLMMFYTLIEHTQQTEDEWRSGVSLVMNLKGFGFKNFDQAFEEILSVVFIDHFPCRVKSVWAFNGGFVLRSIYKLFSYLVSDKILSRFKICGKSDVLKAISPESIPVHLNIGGTSSSSIPAWMTEMESFYKERQLVVLDRLGQLPSGGNLDELVKELVADKKAAKKEQKE